jgi:putative phosphonate catabolism associated alcohol dehydrogenase
MGIFGHVFTGADQPLDWREFASPQLAPGEILVRLDLAAICGSDLHTLAGTRVEPTPCILGHEGVGTVVDLGPDAPRPVGSVVPQLGIGQRVTWSIADSCGRCRPCRDHDLPQKCEALFKYGHAALDDGTGLNGTYASHLVLRPGTTVVPLPDRVGDAVAVAANCALATMVGVMAALRQDRPVVESLVIQGAGLLGLYGCALAVEAGIERVWCTDIDRDRLAVAESFGARAVEIGDPSKATAMIRHAEPGGVDAVIEVAGVRSALDQAMGLLRVGGWLGLVGLVHPDSRFDVTAETLIRRCLTVRGMHNYHPDDLIEAVAFLDRNVDRLDLEQLVSEPLPLSQLPVAIERAMAKERCRMVVRPDSPYTG